MPLDDYMNKEKQYYELVTTMVAAHPTCSQVLRLGDILNTKASALLTHVSVMIAVSTALFGVAYNLPSEKLSNKNTVLFFLSLEVLLYLFTTILVLFAVTITGPHKFGIYTPAPLPTSISNSDLENAFDNLISIIRGRRLCYRTAHIITIVGTIFLFIIVMVEYIPLDSITKFVSHTR